jgi:hypothetical protein
MNAKKSTGPTYWQLAAGCYLASRPPKNITEASVARWSRHRGERNIEGLRQEPRAI